MKEEKKILKKSKPSLGKMVKNFAKAAVEFAAEGFPVVDEEVYKERINTCLNCPELIQYKMQCNNCGCFVTKKAAWKTQNCPLKYWPNV